VRERTSEGVKMRELKLDFCRTRPAPRWVAPLLLAVAVVFAGDAGFAFISTATQVRDREKALAKVEPRTYAASRAASPEEVASARDTVQRLSTPGDSLFTALESAADEHVALLAIEPDPKSGTVLISGDSKDYLSALTYVLNLGRSDSLSHVQLARHEVKTSDPNRPVSFSVSATWSSKK
jgi:Tfp pilus assembly protein PilN